MLPDLSRRAAQVSLIPPLGGMNYKRKSQLAQAVNKVDKFGDLPKWMRNAIKEAEAGYREMIGPSNLIGHFGYIGDLARMQKLFSEEHWHFAVTLPKIPHHYTRRGEWADEEKFVWAVQFIRDHGEEEYFGGLPYTYLYLDGWKYWTMGEALPDTEIINKAEA